MRFVMLVVAVAACGSHGSETGSGGSKKGSSAVVQVGSGDAGVAPSIPRDAEVARALAVELGRAAKWPEALASIDRAISLAPNWPDAHFVAAGVHVALAEASYAASKTTNAQLPLTEIDHTTLSPDVAKQVDDHERTAIAELGRYLDLSPAAPDRSRVIQSIAMMQAHLEHNVMTKHVAASGQPSPPTPAAVPPRKPSGPSAAEVAAAKREAEEAQRAADEAQAAQDKAAEDQRLADEQAARVKAAQELAAQQHDGCIKRCSAGRESCDQYNSLNYAESVGCKADAPDYMSCYNAAQVRHQSDCERHQSECEGRCQ